MNRRKTRFNYVILSDLHLAEGKKRATGQISRFEGFLFDRPFERLLLHLQERAEERDHLWTLVFNGDLIDFLRIPSIPDPNHPPKGFPPIAYSMNWLIPSWSLSKIPFVREPTA